MKVGRWQLIWGLINAIWLFAWAFPIVIMLVEGESDQANDYFAFWLSLVLVPTLVVYFFGILFGRAATSALAIHGPDHLRSKNRRTLWFQASIGWAALVIVFVLVVDTPLNPLNRWATPLAVAIILLVVLLPPVLIFAIGSRTRKDHQKR
jgi:cell division protein FtsW (lipid II flippase)